MSSRIVGKHILISGASSGIGKALAEQLSVNGNTLYLVSRNGEALQQLKIKGEENGATIHTCVADLSIMKEVIKVARFMYEKAPVLDILINNAGISQRSKADDTTEEVDREIMELNFFSPVKLTKLLWPNLHKSSHANIVNISSVTGTFGFPQRSAYAASKHAMEGFFESWMLETKSPNIHFTIVAPGRIQTNISYNALKNDGTKHQIFDSGQAKGISAKTCAKLIIQGIVKNKRKIYIVKEEKVLIWLHRFFPSVFVYLVKKLGLK
jgi:short-subunit dehydrogenase